MDGTLPVIWATGGQDNMSQQKMQRKIGEFRLGGCLLRMQTMGHSCKRTCYVV